MNERPKPNPELTKLAKALVRLQEIREKTGRTAQSIDGSEGLADQALAAGLSKAALKDQSSSS